MPRPDPMKAFEELFLKSPLARQHIEEFNNPSRCSWVMTPSPAASKTRQEKAQESTLPLPTDVAEFNDQEPTGTSGEEIAQMSASAMMKRIPSSIISTKFQDAREEPPSRPQNDNDDAHSTSSSDDAASPATDLTPELLAASRDPRAHDDFASPDKRQLRGGKLFGPAHASTTASRNEGVNMSTLDLPTIEGQGDREARRGIETAGAGDGKLDQEVEKSSEGDPRSDEGDETDETSSDFQEENPSAGREKAVVKRQKNKPREVVVGAIVKENIRATTDGNKNNTKERKQRSRKKKSDSEDEYTNGAQSENDSENEEENTNQLRDDPEEDVELCDEGDEDGGRSLQQHQQPGNNRDEIRTTEEDQVSEIPFRTELEPQVESGRSEQTHRKHRKTPGTETRKKKEVIRMNDWCIQPHPSGERANWICVEGHRIKLDDPEVCWKSSAVAHRLEERLVETASGKRYRLIGKMLTEVALDQGFDEDLVREFRNGFPVHWQKIIETYFERKNMSTLNFDGLDEKEKSRTNRQRDLRKSKRKIKSRRSFDDTPRNTKKTVSAVKAKAQPKRTSSKPKQETEDITEPALLVEDLPRTRSGRIIKPQLKYYAGERYVYSGFTNRVGLTKVTTEDQVKCTPPIKLKADPRVERLLKLKMTRILEEKNNRRRGNSSLSASRDSTDDAVTALQKEKDPERELIQLNELKSVAETREEGSVERFAASFRTAPLSAAGNADAGFTPLSCGVSSLNKQRLRKSLVRDMDPEEEMFSEAGGEAVSKVRRRAREATKSQQDEIVGGKTNMPPTDVLQRTIPDLSGDERQLQRGKAREKRSASGKLLSMKPTITALQKKDTLPNNYHAVFGTTKENVPKVAELVSSSTSDIHCGVEKTPNGRRVLGQQAAPRSKRRPRRKACLTHQSIRNRQKKRQPSFLQETNNDENDIYTFSRVSGVSEEEVDLEIPLPRIIGDTGPQGSKRATDGGRIAKGEAARKRQLGQSVVTNFSDEDEDKTAREKTMRIVSDEAEKQKQTRAPRSKIIKQSKPSAEIALKVNKNGVLELQKNTKNKTVEDENTSVGKNNEESEERTSRTRSLRSRDKKKSQPVDQTEIDFRNCEEEKKRKKSRVATTESESEETGKSAWKDDRDCGNKESTRLEERKRQSGVTEGVEGDTESAETRNNNQKREESNKGVTARLKKSVVVLKVLPIELGDSCESTEAKVKRSNRGKTKLQNGAQRGEENVKPQNRRVQSRRRCRIDDETSQGETETDMPDLKVLKRGRAPRNRVVSEDSQTETENNAKSSKLGNLKPVQKRNRSQIIESSESETEVVSSKSSKRSRQLNEAGQNETKSALVSNKPILNQNRDKRQGASDFGEKEPVTSAKGRKGRGGQSKQAALKESNRVEEAPEPTMADLLSKVFSETTGESRKQSLDEDESETENDPPWTDEEVKLLRGAQKSVPAEAQHYWEVVAAQVESRDATQCQRYHQGELNASARKKPKRAKNQQPKVTKPSDVTGGKGTMKRNRQIKELIQHHDAADKEDADFFGSTPAKGALRHIQMGDDWNNLELNTSMATLETPALLKGRSQAHLLLSSRKTPSSHLVDTPVVEHRNDGDLLVHRMKNKKRVPQPKKTPIVKKPSAGRIPTTVTADTFDLEKHQENDRDSDVDYDYYYSDSD